MILFDKTVKGKLAEGLYRLTLMPCNDTKQEEQAYALMCDYVVDCIEELVKEKIYDKTKKQ